jgi:DNA transformation protein and related proteins
MKRTRQAPKAKRGKTAKPSARTRGTFRSLKVSDGFRDFVLDQLSDVPRLLARPMFGGIGLYSGDVFFGILAADQLYLKADYSTRGECARLGGEPFKPFVDRPMSMNYYGLPLAVVEDRDALARWAERAIATGRAASPPKKARR